MEPSLRQRVRKRERKRKTERDGQRESDRERERGRMDIYTDSIKIILVYRVLGDDDFEV